jgi:hypothetical protein
MAAAPAYLADIEAVDGVAVTQGRYIAGTWRIEVVGVQLTGEERGGEGSGVSGPENDDAVLHG